MEYEDWGWDREGGREDDGMGGGEWMEGGRAKPRPRSLTICLRFLFNCFTFSLSFFAPDIPPRRSFSFFLSL